MKKYLYLILSIIMILSTTVISFANDSTDLSAGTLHAKEKAAILEQVPNAELNSNGSITIPFKNNETVFVDLGNGLTVEYSATIPTLKTTSALAATTKTVSVQKRYWWYNLASMTVTFKANCTWGSPARTVKMNSLTDPYVGSFAEFISHDTEITIPQSSVGGTAEGEATGEIRFYNQYNGTTLGTESYYNTLYVDSADSSTLYLIEN